MSHLPISRAHTRIAMLGVVAGAWLALAPAAMASPYIEDDLVSDGSVPAAHIDPDLINPWGVSYSSTGPFWVSDNGTGVSTIYNSAGATGRVPVTVAPPGDSAAGTISTPTGQVFNSGSASDFMVSSGSTSAKSAFIFATEDGTISGWAPSVNANNSVIAVDNSGSGAVYKGLAIGSNGGSTFLYAANFHSGMVEVYNGAFQQVQTFTDTSLPAGYAPFNVQTLNGHIFVAFALQNATGEDDVRGAGHGFVDEFGMDGTLVSRIASNGTLNSPWGLALAPGQFGQFSNDLLVGNFGDGHINAYDLTSGAFMGQLTDASQNPLAIRDLWALIPGNGGSGGDVNAIYFTAGLQGEAHGLFGSLSPVPEPGQVALILLGLAVMVWSRRGQQPQRLLS